MFWLMDGSIQVEDPFRQKEEISMKISEVNETIIKFVMKFLRLCLNTF